MHVIIEIRKWVEESNIYFLIQVHRVVVAAVCCAHHERHPVCGRVCQAYLWILGLVSKWPDYPSESRSASTLCRTATKSDTVFHISKYLQYIFLSAQFISLVKPSNTVILQYNICIFEFRPYVFLVSHLCSDNGSLSFSLTLSSRLCPPFVHCVVFVLTHLLFKWKQKNPCLFFLSLKQPSCHSIECWHHYSSVKMMTVLMNPQFENIL